MAGRKGVFGRKQWVTNSFRGKPPSNKRGVNYVPNTWELQGRGRGGVYGGLGGGEGAGTGAGQGFGVVGNTHVMWGDVWRMTEGHGFNFQVYYINVSSQRVNF